MVTELGKVLRIIRINTGDSAKVMAEKLDMSPAYLSTIETGKRNIPPDFEKTVLLKYPLSDFDKDRLHKAVMETTSILKVDLSEMQEKKKKVLYSLTKGKLDDKTLDEICKILKENEESDS